MTLLKSLNEAEICESVITPALVASGWEKLVQIRREFSFTAGRVMVRGKVAVRGKQKFADYEKPGLGWSVSIVRGGLMADSKEMIVRTSPLTSVQKDRLTQIEKFLVNIADPATAVPTARFGYDEAEHRLGWSLWTSAAGVGRPLSHALSQVEQMVARSAPSASSVRFVVLDEFENKWFVRVQNAIDRFVAASDREALSKAFFADMHQQPLGPAVVGSVERFLARYADLQKSDVEGVKEAALSLKKKGPCMIT